MYGGEEKDAKKTLPAAKSKAGGRKKGSNDWSKSETDWLLNIVDVILPTGSNHWEKVALEHGKDYGDTLCDVDACKRKFERHTFTVKTAVSTHEKLAEELPKTSSVKIKYV